MRRIAYGIAVLGLAVAASGAPSDEPALLREGFDDARLPDRGWYDGDQFPLNARPGAAQSGAACVEFHWLPKATAPANAATMRHLVEPGESVYVSFYLRLSRGWRWTGKPYHPHLIQLMTTENDKFRGPASSRLTLYIEPWEGRLRLAAQDIQNADAPHGLTQGELRGGFNGKFYDSADALFGDDRWHRVEAEFRLNSLDLERDRPNADGVVRGWVDGKLVVDRRDVVLRSTDFPKMRINQFLLAPYFGPGLLPGEQTLWIDELVVAGERPAERKDRDEAGAGPVR